MGLLIFWKYGGQVIEESMTLGVNLSLATSAVPSHPHVTSDGGGTYFPTKHGGVTYFPIKRPWIYDPVEDEDEILILMAMIGGSK